MDKASKTIITLLLVGTVIGIASLQTNNNELFQGNIGQENDQNTGGATNRIQGLPDLTATLNALPPNASGDIVAEMTISNIGEARVSGAQSFSYTLYLDNTEVINNTDQFTTIEPGDQFTIKYPISRQIYQYGNQGELTFTIDPQNSLPESNEDNNSVTQSFNF